jgi:hypothetical protein
MSSAPTLASLNAASKAQGITLPKAEAKAVLAGATWLKACVAVLEKAGLGK